MAIKISDKSEDRQEFRTSSRKYLETAFCDMRYVSIVLIDIIPVEQKTTLEENLRKLLIAGGFNAEEINEIISNIPDIRKGGHLAASSRIASFYHKKRTKDAIPIIMNERRLVYSFGYVDLPESFEALEVYIQQMVDFAYCVTYTFYIKEDIQPINKDVFTKSQDFVPHFDSTGSRIVMETLQGPEFDPKIMEFEETAAKFLLEYNFGLFINKEESNKQNYPSIRVFSTPQINFDNLETWIDSHYRFLKYLRLRVPLFSRFNETLFTYQEDNILPYLSMPKGISIIYSEVTTTSESEHSNIHWQIFQKTHYLSHSIMYYLFPYYWLTHNSDIIEQNWSNKISKTRTDLVNTENKSITTIRSQMKDVLNLYEDFMTFTNSEYTNIKKINNMFERFGKYQLKVTHQYKIRHEIDIFDEFIKTIEVESKEEVEKIQNSREQIETLLSYYRDLTNVELSASNVSLQSQIKWFTVIAGMVGIVIPVVIKIGEHLKWW